MLIPNLGVYIFKVESLVYHYILHHKLTFLMSAEKWIDQYILIF